MADFTSAASVEMLAPSCLDEIMSLNLNFGHVTDFDSMQGLVIMTEGSTCWNDVREAFQALADFIEEQLAMAAQEELGDKAAEVAEEVG